MSESLKPCPFCGGEAYLDEMDHGRETAYFFICRSCACEGGWAKTEGGAIKNWNMRPAPTSTLTDALDVEILATDERYARELLPAMPAPIRRHAARLEEESLLLDACKAILAAWAFDDWASNLPPEDAATHGSTIDRRLAEAEAKLRAAVKAAGGDEESEASL